MCDGNTGAQKLYYISLIEKFSTYYIILEMFNHWKTYISPKVSLVKLIANCSLGMCIIHIKMIFLCVPSLDSIIGGRPTRSLPVFMATSNIFCAFDASVSEDSWAFVLLMRDADTRISFLPVIIHFAALISATISRFL